LLRSFAPPGLASNEGLESLLLVGRQDFIVKSLRVDSQAEMWNATFARMSLLQPGGSAAGVRSFLEGAVGAGAEASLPARPGEGPGAVRAPWLCARMCF
jgi:hypothetical protein